MSNKDVSQNEPNVGDNPAMNDKPDAVDKPDAGGGADRTAAAAEPAKTRRRAPRKTKTASTEPAGDSEPNAPAGADRAQSGETESSVQADILADLQHFAAEHASEPEHEKPSKSPRRRASSKKTAPADDAENRNTDDSGPVTPEASEPEGATSEAATSEPAQSDDAASTTHESKAAPSPRTRQRQGGSDDTEPSARRARRAAIDPFAIPDEFAATHRSSAAVDSESPDDDAEKPVSAPETRLDTTNAPAGLLFQAPAVEFASPQSRRRDETSDDSDDRRSNDRKSNDDSSAEGSSDDRSSDDSESGGSGNSDASGTDDSQEDKRPRRRRGGRGRRGRSKDDENDDSTEDRDDDSQSKDGDDSSKRGSSAGSSKGGSSKKDSSKDGSSTNDDHDSHDDSDDSDDDSEGGSRKRRRRRRRSGDSEDGGQRSRKNDEVSGVKGSTRLEAKRQRRREGREAGRRRPVITEAEFLARRESVDRHMVVRQSGDRTQIAVLEDKLVVEHYVSQHQQASLIGNVYLGKVQNVLPSMEAAFVDIGRGRNAVLYAGEVNWDAASMQGKTRRIEQALKPGDPVLVQVTKDPIGHKGARLTSQISMPGRFLVYVPGNSMTGISRKLPDTERSRLKKILRSVLPNDAGVIVRTAAEGASEEELTRDVERLSARWEKIEKKSTANSTVAPELLYSEPDLTVRVIRDVFNEDFKKLSIAGDEAWDTISEYVESVAPDLADRLERWDGDDDIFASYRVDEQISKALDRKVNLPSGGSLVIDRTEAMTVVDVNTGKFTGSGGNLEETVTKNNLEAAEEVIRQLRLRDIGGIIVIDFIDMVLESNRDLVLRRLIECLGRDRTKHQVAEVTSLGLVQMTRKRIGTGLVEAYSEPCEHCGGRGIILTGEASEKRPGANASPLFGNNNNKSNRRRGRKDQQPDTSKQDEKADQERDEEAEKAAAANREALAKVAAAAKKSHTDTDSQQVVEEAPAPSKRGGKGSNRNSKKRSGNREQQGSGESKPAEPVSVPAAESKPAEPASVPAAESKPADTKPADTKPSESKPAEPEVPDPNAPMMLGVGAKPVVMVKAEPKRRPRREPKAEPVSEPAATESASPAGPVIMLGMDSTKKSD